jgi:hypothetical protein
MSAKLIDQHAPAGLVVEDPAQIQSLWRDRAALDAMRADPEPPVAPALFRRLGAEPVLRIYGIRARHAARS